MVTLMCKIFFMSNQITVAPYLTKPGNLGPWITLFKQILEFDLGAEFETPTESHEAIEALNKSPSW